MVYQPTGNNDVPGPGGLVFDQAGNLYGTSGSGGAYGAGAVFELTPSPGGWTEQILVQLHRRKRRKRPSSLVADSDGNLYGTAGGGEFGNGVVFQLVRLPSGGSWKENVIYTFNFQGEFFGGGPYSLVQASLGNLFGIASYEFGGPYPYIEVFELSPSGGSWVFSQIYNNGTLYYLAWSNSNLATDAAGEAYWASGWRRCDEGHIDASGSVTIDFSNWLWYGDEMIFLPAGTLGLDFNRNVYGITSTCGKYNQGTIWRVTQ